jgi:hypothetical protein
VEYVQYPDTTQLTCTHKREHNRKHWIVATCKTYTQKLDCESNIWCVYTPLTFPYGGVFELLPAQELKFRSATPADQTRGMISKGKAMCPDPAGTEFTFKRDSITGYCPSAENCIRLATGKQYSITEYAVIKSKHTHSDQPATIAVISTTADVASPIACAELCEAEVRCKAFQYSMHLPTNKAVHAGKTCRLYPESMASSGNELEKLDKAGAAAAWYEPVPNNAGVRIDKIQ